MPRVSAAHEQEVRDRILAAAARVFAEKGYHSSTIADVVRESGLSVGAIYTYFSGKDELIRLTCDQIAARGLDELAARLAAATTTAERLAIAIRLYVETIDEYDGAPGQVTLVQAWAEADREPGVREMLAGRRERLAGRRPAAPAPGRDQRRAAGLARRRRGHARAARAARRPDAPAHRSGRRVPAGRPRAPCDGHRRAAARRRVRRDPHPGARPDGVASRAMAHVQTVLGPIEPDSTRVHPAARAHPDRAVAHPGSLGLLAADPRRAGDPRGARAVPCGGRERARRRDPAGRRARPGLAARRWPRPAACTS